MPGGDLLAHPVAQLRGLRHLPVADRDPAQGMLGADLIGFHTQYHCNNFLETVERAIEARVDWEHFSVDPRPARHPR